MGMIFVSFNISGHCPILKDLLNMFANGVDIDFFIECIRALGMLFGPVLLFISIFEMISSISWEVVGFSMNVLGLGFFK